MFPNNLLRKQIICGPKKQAGSMLAMAVFFIVVMSVLGLAATRILSTSADAVAYEVVGLRAMNAARSGLEDYLYNIFPRNNDVGPHQSCDDVITTSFAGVSGLEDCQVSSYCELSSVDGSPYYRFSSTGSCTSGDLIVSRTVEIDAREVQ